MTPEIIRFDAGTLHILDQTELPQRVRVRQLSSLDEVVEAIRSLRVRGAPLIGVTAAFGVCVAVASCTSAESLRQRAPDVLDALRGSRPTAVNLFWAIDRMAAVISAATDPSWRNALESEARLIFEQVKSQDAAMARWGVALLEKGARVITHCNTGPLATGAQGTALGVLIEAHRKFEELHVMVDETRPRWQGAHLTTWELATHGVPHTLMVDNAAAALMAQGEIHSVWVGADRIAANGDAANKIGTYGLAVAANYHGVPFYVVAPTSTVDLSLPNGSRIPIELRDAEEVAAPHGYEISPQGTAVWNPAFDITPAALISAIVTEQGAIMGPDYDLHRQLANS